ncbi:multidrug efflux SMR transporter [Castellaniella sp.]|uniref:DMT family transporter n=1 Tax=Castellaniella sp. TaxID=1955812 RepID=UPI002AFE521D|nr:multidrug efflux SMR transporter [Castellaniella sp.]
MFLRPWLFLLAAVAVEVISVTVMKRVSLSGSLSALLLMYALIGLSFVFLATAVKYLPLALAYAAWESIGLICITVIGLRYFGETLDLFKLLGMGALLAGVVLVNLGASDAPCRRRNGSTAMPE